MINPLLFMLSVSYGTKLSFPLVLPYTLKMLHALFLLPRLLTPDCVCKTKTAKIAKTPPSFA